MESSSQISHIPVQFMSFQSIFSFEEFHTFLTQNESWLDFRSISKPSNDPDNLLYIIPGHFLTDQKFITLPHPGMRELTLNCLKCWHFIQQMFQICGTTCPQSIITHINNGSSGELQSRSNLAYWGCSQMIFNFH